MEVDVCGIGGTGLGIGRGAGRAEAGGVVLAVCGESGEWR